MVDLIGADKSQSIQNKYVYLLFNCSSKFSTKKYVKILKSVKLFNSSSIIYDKGVSVCHLLVFNNK